MRRPFVRLADVRAREQPAHRPTGSKSSVCSDATIGPRKCVWAADTRTIAKLSIAIHARPRNNDARFRAGSNRDDVARCRADRLASGELVAVDVRQRNRQRRRRDPLGLDDRQPRHATAAKLDSVHPDRPLFELGHAATRIQSCLGRNRDRRGKARSLERHRQCAARDQGLDDGCLARRCRLVAGDDFFGGQRTRADDLHTLGELILAGARRHPDDEVAGGEAHALSARGRRCNREGVLGRTRHE